MEQNYIGKKTTRKYMVSMAKDNHKNQILQIWRKRFQRRKRRHMFCLRVQFKSL